MIIILWTINFLKTVFRYISVDHVGYVFLCIWNESTINVRMHVTIKISFGALWVVTTYLLHGVNSKLY